MADNLEQSGSQRRSLGEISLLNEDPHFFKLPQIDLDQISYPLNGMEVLGEQIEMGHFWFIACLNRIKECLINCFGNSQPVGLDIGCGTGWFTSKLTASGFTTTGIDALPRFAAHENDPGARFYCGDIFGFIPKAEFDYVLLMDVMEHIEDDTRFFAQAVKFLKPGGIAIIHVPAFRWLWSPDDVAARHLRRYTKCSFHKVVAAASNQLAELKLETAIYCYASTLPLYAISRWKEYLRRGKPIFLKKTEYRPPRFLNKILGAVLSLEQKWVRRPLFGSSLLAVVRRTV